jgi:hypothetical protein
MHTKCLAENLQDSRFTENEFDKLLLTLPLGDTVYSPQMMHHRLGTPGLS